MKKKENDTHLDSSIMTDEPEVMDSSIMTDVSMDYIKALEEDCIWYH